MFVVFLCSSLAWWLSWERLPDTVRIAAGYPGGLYHRVGKSLEGDLERLLDHPIEIIETKGSVENQKLLLRGEVDVAVLQHGSVKDLVVRPSSEEVTRFINAQKPPPEVKDFL